jgi:hypothetical protein
MKRSKFSLPPVLGYHGCDREVGEAVLAGKSMLEPSKNDYDWLGKGIYFWVDSYQRGYDWAVQQSKGRRPRVKEPFVLGAFIYPGLCLNLTDYGVREQLVAAHAALIESFQSLGVAPPVNQKISSSISLKRHLDCAVINVLHGLREQGGDPSYDTVYGFFEEGGELYPGSELKEKTHVQISVINQDCILGYFRATPA